MNNIPTGEVHFTSPKKQGLPIKKHIYGWPCVGRTLDGDSRNPDLISVIS